MRLGYDKYWTRYGIHLVICQADECLCHKSREWQGDLRGRAADVHGAALFSDRVFSCIWSSWAKYEKARKQPLDLLQIQGKERTTGVRNLQDVWKWSRFLEMCRIWQWIAFGPHEPLCRIRDITSDHSAENRRYARNQDFWWEHISVSSHIVWVFWSIGWIWRTDRQSCFSADHPSPRERQEHIFDLLDEISKELDIEEGNEVLNIFFDSADRLKNITLQQKWSSAD